MKRTGPTNPVTQELIRHLRELARKQKVQLWARLAEELERPSRKRRAVNIATISRNSSPDETVAVPGKVLSVGELEHPVTVAAYQFSRQAQEKIIQKKGICLELGELMKKNPQAKGVRILG